MWKRALNGSKDDKMKALMNFLKNAHREGGDFVLEALGDSLVISSCGTVAITLKGVEYEIQL